MPSGTHSPQLKIHGFTLIAGLLSAAAHAADCNIGALSDAQRYNYSALPTYFEISKSYELGSPFTLKPGEQLAYRKLGRKNLYLVPEADIVYKPDWFLSLSFRLNAGHPYQAEVSQAKDTPLYVIRQSGGQGNSQLLYVNRDGALCERVGSYSAPSGGLGAVTTLVKGTYASTPVEAHLQLTEETDSRFSKAFAITLSEEGSAVLKLTLNQFNANGLERTVSKAFDRNTTEDLQFEGWRFALRRQGNGTYTATVLTQPN
ncbi:hypothetical protein [Chitinimonas sp.]|uniref:hypothetical protein n=1 Tax=Chitinimonas sp. TaxID=1934313 RepID=UPI0035B03ECD